MKSIYTPWGESHSVKEWAPGIISVTTASHGGFILDADALARMPADLRKIKTWAGEGAYEEDCDWAIVALAFPSLFQIEQLDSAVQTVIGSGSDYHKEARAWLYQTLDGSQILKLVNAWRLENREKYQLGGGGTHGKGWLFFAYRLKDNQVVHIVSPDYLTTQHPHTLAEFIGMGAKVLADPDAEIVRERDVSVPAFNEADCGGVWDGVQVTSDADPGL